MSTPTLLKPSGRWIVAIAIALGLATAGFGYFAYSVLRPSSVETTETSPDEAAPSPDISAKVAALGRLEPRGGIIKIAAPSSLGSSRVNRLLVREGATVKAGQVIAVMDNSDRLLAAAIEAQAEVRQAEARLAQVKAGAKRGDIEAQKAAIGRLQVELGNAQREYQRYRSLYENGAISASDMDSKRLVVESISQQLNQARQVLVSVAEVRPTDVQQAEAEVGVALAKLQRAKADLDTALVRAPINGRIIKIHTDPGEVVGNDGIAEMGNTEQMYAVAEVYETDVGRIRPGQQAIITSKAFAGEIPGVVEQIGWKIGKNDVLNTDPAANTDTRVIEVKIRLADSLKVAGMTNLQVNVAIAPGGAL